MEITNYRPIDKEFFKGTFDVKFPEWDLIIRKLNYFIKGNRSWISWPSESYMKDGEKKYYPYIAFGQDTDTKMKADIVKKVQEYLNNNPQNSQKKSQWDNLIEQEIRF